MCYSCNALSQSLCLNPSLWDGLEDFSQCETLAAANRPTSRVPAPPGPPSVVSFQKQQGMRARESCS